MIQRLTLVLGAAAVLLASCAEGGDGGVPSRGASPTLPDASLHVKPSAPSSLGGTITGVFGMAEIETGCPYLETADGDRYEVLYPEGWNVRRAPLELVAPDGRVVARAGDEVTVRGRPAPDMSSICMIGPIFRAEEVVVAGDSDEGDADE